MNNNNNPYAPRLNEDASSRHDDGTLHVAGLLLWTGITTFGASMTVLTLLASFVWDGRFTLYGFDNQSHAISAITSAALSCGSVVALFLSIALATWHLRVSLLTVLALAGIGFLIYVDWPIASLYIYFDLSNVFAAYAAIGFFPAVALAFVPLPRRNWWHVIIPFAMLGTIAIYVAARTAWR